MADDDDFDSPPPPPDDDDENDEQPQSRRSSHINNDSDDEDRNSDDGDDGNNDESDQDNDSDGDGEGDDSAMNDVFGDDDDDDDDDEDSSPQKSSKASKYRDEEDDEDEDLALSRDKSRKRKKTKRSANEKDKGRKPKKSRSNVARFFADQAEVADESESDAEDIVERGVEEIQSKDILEANQRVERRHQAARERLNRSAEDIAREFEDRARNDLKISQAYSSRGYGGEEELMAPLPGRMPVASKQSLLPSISDPGIWKVKCTTGKEASLVRALMLKTIDHKNKTGIMRIKSAFTTSTKGMVYIEAMAEPFAKEAVQGLYGFFTSSFSRIPVEDMTSLFNIQFKKKPLTVGQWVRLKRGPLKGDLAQIVELLEGGVKAIIKAIPRPDYSGSYGNKNLSSTQGALRPPQKLFDPEEVRITTGSLPERQRFGSDREMYDVFNGDFYRNGFMFKEVNVSTYVQSVDINPKIEELQLFLSKRGSNGQPIETGKTSSDKKKGDDDDYFAGHDSDDDDDRSSPVKSASKHTSAAGTSSSQQASESLSQLQGSNILYEIATQLKDTAGLDDSNVFVDEKKKVIPFVTGDLVQITSGELKNLVGKVVGINQVTKIIRVAPKNSSFKNEVDVESGILVKYITPGAHVKVINGQYTGQTGRVVAVNLIDSDHIAALLTDSTNTEIQCNLEYLQISDEVTSGLSALNGYELYDLVVVNDNESAVVIHVGAEKLRVLNQSDIVKEFLPQELHGKRNTQSQRSSAFDAQQNSVKIGDSVNVTSGLHANRSGTVKHIMKGNLWLHSNSYLKNSGVFVIKGRSCVVAGNTKKLQSGLGDLNSGYIGANGPSIANSLTRPTVATSKPPPGKSAPGHGGHGKGGKDPDIGKTVRIIKGGSFKGLLGTVVDATPTHYSLELLARFKKIIIERELTVVVGTKEGSFTASRDTYQEAPPTPYIGSSDTPAYLGSQTPRVAGSETPGYYGSETPGSRTPNVSSGDAGIWKYGEYDSFAARSSAPGSSRGRESTGGYSESDNGVGVGWNRSASSSAYQPPSQAMGSLSSPYSPYNASVSGYSPSSAVYSPNAHGSSSPAIPVSNSTPELWTEWERGFVVVVSRGELTGKLAVIDSKPDLGGTMYVRLQDSYGNIDYSRAPYNIPTSDASLAELKIGANATVFTGKYRGLKGPVTAIDGRDVSIKVGGQEQWCRTQVVAMVNQM